MFSFDFRKAVNGVVINYFFILKAAPIRAAILLLSKKDQFDAIFKNGALYNLRGAYCV